MISGLPDILAYARSGSRGRAIFHLAIGLLVGGVFLTLAVRNADWSRIRSDIAAADLKLITVAFLLLSTGSLLRSLRWRTLLAAEIKLPIITVFWATMTGYAGNNLLPLRAGEVLRSYLVGAVSGTSKAFCLASALSERVLDTFILLLVLFSVMASAPQVQMLTAGRLEILAVGLAAACVGFALVVKLWRAMVRNSPNLTDKVRKLVGVVENFASGFRAIFDIRRGIAALVLSIGAWCIDAFAGAVIAQSLYLDLAPHKAIVLLAFLGLASALPSAPGYVGTYQFVAVAVLVPIGFSHSEALAYILLLQSVIVSCAIFWGSIGFTRLASKLSEEQAGHPRHQRVHADGSENPAAVISGGH